MQDAARDVVGPDERPRGQTREEADAEYWGWLAGMLRANGVDIDASTLRALPHDVELSDGVLARIGHPDANP